MSLEQIVRPFTDVGTNPVKGVATIPAPSTNVMLVVSGGGSVVSGATSYSFSYTTYAEAHEDEVLQKDDT
jgi:hypothetical protein